MVQVSLASVIIYCLTVVPCLDPWIFKLETMLFRFLWNSGKPLVRRSTCSQKSLNGVLGVPRLLMNRYALRLMHTWLYLDGYQAWNPITRNFFLRVTSLKSVKQEKSKCWSQSSKGNHSQNARGGATGNNSNDPRQHQLSTPSNQTYHSRVTTEINFSS